MMRMPFSKSACFISLGGFTSFGNTCGDYLRDVKVLPSCARGLSDGRWLSCGLARVERGVPMAVVRCASRECHNSCRRRIGERILAGGLRCAVGFVRDQIREEMRRG